MTNKIWRATNDAPRSVGIADAIPTTLGSDDLERGPMMGPAAVGAILPPPALHTANILKGK